MNILTHLKLRTKLALLLGLASLAVVAAIGLGASTLHQRMLLDRIDKLQTAVELSVGLARELNEQVTTQRMTMDQAQDRFRTVIHALRFDDGNGYISVQTEVADGGYIILAHGSEPAREGKSSSAKDSDGRLISDLMRETLTGHDSGVVSYLFPKPGTTAPVQKVSYLRRFEPWRAVVLAGAYTDDLDSDFNAAISHLAVIGGLILLVTLLAAWMINRDITRSLYGLRSAMDRLAKGDIATVIPGTDRRDEVGGMAGAVLVFKLHMEKAQLLAAEQEQERERAAADKRRALVAMADKIDAETAAALQAISGRTAAMTATAEEMTASAGRTGGSAQSAMTASAQALANAQTVASAAEQLSASIREIGGQVAQSTEVVNRAVTAGTETRATIEALNEQVARIGAVADMIGEIASKTNLLALNATIEAARAGDAGKGFAVVASEVKALAAQTARSTQQIGQHINEVRSATGASVSAVARIEQTINEIDAIAGSIAAAVEQQGAATAEIARNVSETASAADAMTSRTAEVSIEAERTGKHAAEVRENAAAMIAAVTEFRQVVTKVVRTSTAEVDRRVAERRQVSLPCRLNMPGQPAQTARIVDISQGGAAVHGGPTLQPGARGTMEIEGTGLTLPFTVRARSDGALHVAFDPDAAAATKLAAIIERSTMQRAA
ncbi:MAG TPA: cache domain-containing protein [Rhodopila sp.]